MKTLKVTGLVIFGLLAAGCGDDEMDSTNRISSEEQAEMVATAMGNSGFAAAGKQSAEYIDEAFGSRMAECGYTNENSGSFSGMIGSTISFSLSYAFGVELICENESPSQFNSEFMYEGSFDGPRFASDYSGMGSFIFTQLDEAFAEYELNGNYERNGSFESKIGDMATGSSEIDVDIDNVMIDKSTKQIVGGSADLSILGTISGKGDYSFDAHIEFHADGTATIITSGDTFTMNMLTGSVTASGHL